MAHLIDELRGRNDTTIDAAKELMRGLMRGNREELKLGYSWENASLAADRAFGEFDQSDGEMRMPKLDAHEVKFYALGFARGMHGAVPENEEELEAKMRAISERYAYAYGDGRRAGLLEDRAATHPAALPGVTEVVHTTDEAPKPTGAETEMKTCGCGATTVGECAAAVEGYFTSLGQRSDEELQVLGDEEDGDGCTAAQAVLAIRRQDQEGQ